SDVIWTGWCIFYLAIFIPLSLFLTLVGQKLFLYSDMGLIFLYFMSFFLAALAFCVFVSIIFSKAKTGSIFGCFVFFAGYFIFDALLDTGKSRSQLLLACLHPSTAFSFGTSAFKEYEDNKIGVTAETWDVSDDNPITFQDVVMMQFVDVAWILALSWYLSQVWPSEYGLHKPWYFLFLPSYWISTCTPWCSTSQHQILVSHAEDSGIELSQRSAGSAVDDVPIETVPKNLLDQVGEKKCVHIHNLRKSFHTNTGTKVAVDGLDMTFYSGQITALLGHNGAGKSTAINMLTGLYPPDEGSAVIQGFDGSQDMYEVRKILGVCPQHDVLQPYMTVEEHLEFFASVKGCSPEEIQQEVTRLIDAVGLKEKRKEYSKNLSGGQKRRVIILVTHFMDEADLLGDRIAIMGDGKLRCCGSPLFLKRAFGVGYNITIEKNAVANFDVTGTIGTISQFVADAKLLTNVGTELSVQLPFTGSAGFQPLFEYFDDNMESMGIKSYGMSVTTLEEVFLKVASGTNTISTALGGMEPREERIQKAAEPRENGHKYHTVIAADEVTEGALVVGSEMREESPPQSAQPLGSEEVYEQVESTDPESQQKKPYELDEAAKVGEFKPIEMFFQHMKALLLKRYLYFIRDSRSWGFQFALPIIFVLGGALLMHFNEWAPDQPMIVISASNYNKGMSSDFLPLPFTAATDVCPIRSDCSKSMYAISGQEYIMNSIMDASKFPMEPQYDGLSGYNISDFVLKQRDQYKASRFGAITFTDILYNDSSVNSGGIQEVRYLVHGNYTGQCSSLAVERA
ncbi:ABCA3, partial [Symbiodinium microadriaticum]